MTDKYDVTKSAVVNSDPLISNGAREIAEIVFQCGIQPLIVCVGIPGNIISAVVFFAQGLKDRVNLLLFSLALVDLINLLSQLPSSLSCLPRWGWGDLVDSQNWYVVTATLLRPYSRWAGFVSAILIVLMSVDRSLSVTLPLKAGRILTYRPMLVAIVVSYLAPLACFLPNFFIYRVFWTKHPSTNRSLAYMGMVDDVIHPSVSTRIVAVLNVVIKPVAVIIVVVCCLITLVTLHQASKKRYQMQQGNQKETEGRGGNRITTMLIFLCAVYVVLVLPEVSATLVNYFVPDFFVFGRYHNTFLVVYEVIFTASCLNSSANFFAYLLLSSKFRGTLKGFCATVGCRQRNIDCVITKATEF